MKNCTLKSLIGLLVMTLALVTMQVIPVQAATFKGFKQDQETTSKQEIKVGDYIYYGTYLGKDILWYVAEKDEKGLLLYESNRYEQLQNSKKNIIDKIGKFTKENDLEDLDELFDVEEIPSLFSLITDGTINWADITAVYLDPNAIVFKLGEGTKQNPYTIYTEWKETPTLKANGNQVTLYNVELVGTKVTGEVIPTIVVDGVSQSISNINYDGDKNTLVYQLYQPIKQGQSVQFTYSLAQDATTAIAKAGDKVVLKQVSTAVKNETVDYVPQPVTLTKGLQNEGVKLGDSRTLSVIAKGEGVLTFNWYKEGNWIYGETFNSSNQDVTSSYVIKNIRKEDLGKYRVEISNDINKLESSCTVNLLQQYQVRTATYPVEAGALTNNSINQDGIYTINDVATVTATPKGYYRFTNWTENGKEVSRDRSYSFAVTQDRNLVANFYYDKPVVIPQYTIYVTINPKDTGTVRGDYTYNKGEYVTVKAKAKEGYIFENWTEDGKVVSRNEEYSFTVERERRLKANFTEEQPKELSFKQAWRALSSRQQKAIEENFEEYLPYTTLEETLSLDELEGLTKGYFTKDQLREVKRDLSLLEDIGIDLDWEVVELRRVSSVSFKDLGRNHWAYSNITELAKRGIVAGYPDGTFRPSKPLTVEDTFTFLDRVLLLNDQTEVQQPRSTVEKYMTNSRSWAFDSMASVGSKLEEKMLRQVGRMEDTYLSRGQLAQVLFEVTNGNLKKIKPLVLFTDTRYSEYEDGINYCIRTGLLEGTTATTMEPNKAVTRAEMMTILMRLDAALNQ
ncbi:S-layer homology domain-containing protein [Niameybacter massiliensis]|uniref:S-layer homology domain-containing protein n=1 Tax=Holtiella tumoricola TaxID=3018743 RepID=A0AA42DPL6_9FIRM|nr:S-layer homology domain-containing protein [Holtiella tumoricola]MDA3732803.1 S-layer homology domain-containing protein [Holtiella tumoricola]